MLRAGKLRHRATIRRPSGALDSRGQRSGADATILRDVPCSLEPLAGRELERARQTVAEVTHRVAMYRDPEHPVQPLDYLEINGRVLWVRWANDQEELGFAYELLCEEEL